MQLTTTQSYKLHDFLLVIDTARGVLSITSSGRTLDNIEANVSYHQGDEVHRLSLIRNAMVSSMTSGDTGLSCRIITEELTARLEFIAREHDQFLECRCELHAIGTRADLLIDAVELLDAPIAGLFPDVPPTEVRFRGQTIDVWSQPGTGPLAGVRQEDDLAPGGYYLAGGLYHGDDALTLSYLLPCQWIDSVVITDGRVLAKARLDTSLSPKDTLYTDRLFLNLSQPMPLALADFGAKQKPRHTAAESADHSGWNSWDYYHLEITQQQVRENLTAINALPWLRDQLRYIIIDDGWETMVGDWEPDTLKFPQGMSAMATEIHDAGFVPGIWSAPFFADTHCDILQRHPECAVQYRGEPYSPYKIIGCDPPWGDRCYLDPTHPRVQEHVYQLYRKLYRWGFRYFKTDFLSDPLRAVVSPELSAQDAIMSTLKSEDFTFYDAGMGLLRAHRACMHAIRAAIGEESFWLGCGSYIATGAELMDASRISSDIAAHYPNLLQCARGMIFNAPLHGAIWLNDPDFAIFRGTETYDPAMLDIPIEGTKPYKRKEGNSGRPFSVHEARLWATTLILSGGLITLSDRINGWNAHGQEIVKTLLAYAGGRAAIPLDYQHPLPGILLKSDGPRRLLGVINWSETPQTFHIIPSASLPLPTNGMLRNLWTGAMVDVKELQHMLIPAHDGELFAWELV